MNCSALSRLHANSNSIQPRELPLGHPRLHLGERLADLHDSRRRHTGQIVDPLGALRLGLELLPGARLRFVG